jgi:hypothetical protein
MNPALRKAYFQTTYLVRAPQGVHALRIGARHPAFDVEVEGAGARVWAVVTAWNPGSLPRTASENAKAQAEMVQAISALGLGSWGAEGKADGGGWREESLCVLDMDGPSAVALGRRFNQLAVVVGRVGEAAQLLAVATA